MIARMALLLTLIQAVLGLRVVFRLLATAGGERIRPAPDFIARAGDPESVSVIVPVLDEEHRLAPCLDGLIAQGPDVHEILVVDGGSTDGTRELVRGFTSRDPRIRLIDATPVPDGVNGKAHGLHAGLEAANPDTGWVLTIDADVRPAPALVRSLLDHAANTGRQAMSVATQQRLSGLSEGVVHPSMLATLVYRFGIPGQVTSDVSRVQANGQCFLVARPALDRVGGFRPTYDSVCEDVTLARMLAGSGIPVGFHEGGSLVSVTMYESASDAWTNWSRSLPMRDRFSGWWSLLHLVEVTLVQALPPWLLVAAGARLGRNHPLVITNIALACTRAGVLAGMARAYESRPWTYWLSPAADLPVAARLWHMYFRRRHVWRNRQFVSGDGA